MRSPTLEMADAAYPEWWNENGGSDGSGYDRDGYDPEGWSPEGLDRARQRPEDYSNPKKAAPSLASARAVASTLRSRLSRRIPRSIARAVETDAKAILRGLFGSQEGSGMEVRSGFNADGCLYVGAYWPGNVEINEYFVVIVEEHTAGQAGADPRSTWSATVMRREAPVPDPAEDRLVGKATRAELAEGIALMAKDFRPGRSPHVIYIEDAGTPDARFGAAAACEFDEQESCGRAPGDRIATVDTVSPATALEAFRALAPRTAGFNSMVDSGMVRAGPVARP